MKSNRLLASLVMGVILGIICIVGGSARAGGITGNELYLVAMWYNRVIIGLVIGFAGQWVIVKHAINRYIRGGLLGLFVSTAFFLSTNLRDFQAFVAGIFYGMIIELVLWFLYERIPDN